MKALLEEFREREGILEIRVWINQGELAIGDDIMLLAVAGRFRTDIMPVFQELLRRIKTEIVTEKEEEEIIPVNRQREGPGNDQNISPSRTPF